MTSRHVAQDHEYIAGGGARADGQVQRRSDRTDQDVVEGGRIQRCAGLAVDATYGIDVATHQTVWSYLLSGKLALSPSRILYIEGRESSDTPAVQGALTAINVK